MPTSAYVIGPLVVLLTALFAVGYFLVPLYWAYKITEPFQRADAVRGEVARLRAALRDAERPPPAVPADAIRADAYRDCLRATPIHKLKSYAGVGDVTVQRLDEAGYLTLHDADGRLTQPTFHVPGIGPSRVTEIVNAARAELRHQSEAFDRGANQYAQRAAVEVARLTAQRDAEVARDRASATRLRQTLHALQPQLSAADKVTFWAYLRHRKASPGQPWPCDPVLAAPSVAVAPPAVADLPIARRADPIAVPQVPPPAPKFPANVEAIATLLFGVARADGRLATSETAAVRRGLAKFFETDPVLVRFIDPALERLSAAPLDLDAALRLATGLPRRERDLLRRCADEVASATATRHAAKAQMVERFRRALTLPGDVTVPPPVADPSELRSNELLDGLFAGPAPMPTAAVPVAAGQGLRDNALLDDVFGGS